MIRHFVEFEEDYWAHQWTTEKISEHYGVAERTAIWWKKRVIKPFQIQAFLNKWKK